MPNRGAFFISNTYIEAHTDEERGLKVGFTSDACILPFI